MRIHCSLQCRRLVNVAVAVRVDGGGNLPFLSPTPLLIFDRHPPPWYKFISLPSLPLPLKSKMVPIIFVMKLLSTRFATRRFLEKSSRKNRDGATIARVRFLDVWCYICIYFVGSRPYPGGPPLVLRFSFLSKGKHFKC